jgi:hypothetical protein
MDDVDDEHAAQIRAEIAASMKWIEEHPLPVAAKVRRGRRGWKTTTFGQKGGTGPTLGKKAAVYEVTLPDGRMFQKRKFGLDADTLIATAYRYGAGRDEVDAMVWPGEPAWEGDFGRLVAKRIK